MALMKRWNKILSCRDVCDVYIDATQEELAPYLDISNEDYSYESDNVSPISQLLKDGFIRPCAAKQLISEIESNPIKVLEDPNAVYFLDISAQDAANIQKQYGVICKNENEIDDHELEEWKEYISVKGETGVSWREFLKGIRNMPTNSIIISDRYLFKSDNKPQEGWDGGSYTGIDSAVDIIDGILPDTFSSQATYNVLILYSSRPNKNQYESCKIPFNKLAKRLSGKIKELRNYKIKVELLSIDFGYQYYDITHNRRVITNYHIIRTEHELKAFANNKSMCSQTLNWDSLFSKGLLDNNSSPIKNQSILINGLIMINKYGIDHIESSNYQHGVDGVCPKSDNDKNRVVFSEIQNRLLKTV